MEGTGKNNDAAVPAVVHADHGIASTRRELPLINPVTVKIIAATTVAVIGYLATGDGDVSIEIDGDVDGDVNININTEGNI